MQFLAITGLIASVLASAGLVWYKYKSSRLEGQLQAAQAASLTSATQAKQASDRLEAVFAEAKAKADREAEQDAKKADAVTNSTDAANWLNGLH